MYIHTQSIVDDSLRHVIIARKATGKARHAWQYKMHENRHVYVLSSCIPVHNWQVFMSTIHLHNKRLPQTRKKERLYIEN
jgi:hypothetical protein